MQVHVILNFRCLQRCHVSWQLTRHQDIGGGQACRPSNQRQCSCADIRSQTIPTSSHHSVADNRYLKSSFGRRQSLPQVIQAHDCPHLCSNIARNACSFRRRERRSNLPTGLLGLLFPVVFRISSSDANLPAQDQFSACNSAPAFVMDQVQRDASCES